MSDEERMAGRCRNRPRRNMGGGVIVPVGSSTVVAGLTVADSIVAPLDGLCEPLARLHVANGAVHGDTTSAISHTAETFASRELGIDRMRV